MICTAHLYRARTIMDRVKLIMTPVAHPMTSGRTTHAPRTVFLHLVGDHALILSRMEGRDHFMPTSLLESQEATLEPLEADENGVVFDVTETPERIASAFLLWLRTQEDA